MQHQQLQQRLQLQKAANAATLDKLSHRQAQYNCLVKTTHLERAAATTLQHTQHQSNTKRISVLQHSATAVQQCHVTLEDAVVALVGAVAVEMKLQGDVSACLVCGLEAEREASVAALARLEEEGRQQCRLLQDRVEEQNVELQQLRSAHSTAANKQSS